jgi:hypothetical protein
MALIPRGTHTRTIARAALIAALTLAVAAPAALAGKPVTGPSANFPYAFPAGAPCTNAVVFENTSINSRDSAFDPARDGSWRLLTRGSAVSQAVDQETGAVYAMRGGYRFQVTFAADGSFRVDGAGTDIIAWYFPGDDSDLPPGLWDVDGRITEWYAADGSFLKATFDGHATDICAALED